MVHIGGWARTGPGGSVVGSVDIAKGRGRGELRAARQPQLVVVHRQAQTLSKSKDKAKTSARVICGYDQTWRAGQIAAAVSWVHDITAGVKAVGPAAKSDAVGSAMHT